MLANDDYSGHGVNYYQGMQRIEILIAKEILILVKLIVFALKLQCHGDLVHNVESIYRHCSLKQYLQDCDGHHRFSGTVSHVVLLVTHSNINVNKFVLTESG